MSWTALFQASIPATDNTPADLHVNTFHVRDEAGSPPAAGSQTAIDICDVIADQLAIFYGNLKTAGAMNGYNTRAIAVKMYDVLGPKPNYPLAEVTVDQGAAATDFDLPPEVALCLSYRNNTADSTPRARRRGRIYIGGWDEGANGTDGRPVTTAVNALMDAGELLYDNISSNFGTWCIWSPTAGAHFAMQELLVDNEWDTMRSRGRLATTRVVEPVP